MIAANALPLSAIAQDGSKKSLGARALGKRAGDARRGKIDPVPQRVVFSVAIAVFNYGSVRNSTCSDCDVVGMRPIRANCAGVVVLRIIGSLETERCSARDADVSALVVVVSAASADRLGGGRLGVNGRR